ncbi:MAG: AzlD domain-containing protein [Spirochaetes bacterium]|nr:AzlD domain-containing protein [Spirochaetota bacterium]
MLSVQQALVASFVMGAIIAGLRAAPFLFFGGRTTPAFLGFVERYLPPVAMTALVVASYASVRWLDGPHGLPELAAGTAVALLHLWKRNALLSIVGGTALYMALASLA